MVRECACRLGFRCEPHRQCQDVGREHRWYVASESFRLVYDRGYRGPTNIGVQHIERMACEHCDRVDSVTEVSYA